MIRRAPYACAFAALFVVAWPCALADAQDRYDLQARRRALPHGPVIEQDPTTDHSTPREDVAPVPAPYAYDEEAVALEDELDSEPIRVPRATSLYAQALAGTRYGLALGGRLRSNLTLALETEVQFVSLMLGENAGSNARLRFAVYGGPLVDFYPRDGIFHLRATAGVLVGTLNRSAFVDDVSEQEAIFRVMPSMSVGGGVQWRPFGVAHRFRLGLLVHTGLATSAVARDRVYLFDVGLSTTVTWF